MDTSTTRLGADTHDNTGEIKVAKDAVVCSSLCEMASWRNTTANLRSTQLRGRVEDNDSDACRLYSLENRLEETEEAREQCALLVNEARWKTQKGMS